MAATGLRQLTPADLRLISKFATQPQHGRVLRATRQTADSDGGIAVPFERLSTLRLLEARGVISAIEARAGERFNFLFQRGNLDGLRAADMSREPVSGGRMAGDLPPSAERSRKRIADAMAALGGHGSLAASVIWHVVGLEWPTRRWAISTQRRQDQATGILIGALSALAAHFAGSR
jgi:hypothetical protein